MAVKDWKKALVARRALEKRAKDEHTRAQLALERARAADLHPRTALVIARDKASAKLRLRRRQVAEAEKAVKAISGRAPKLSPEITVISPNRSSRNGVKPRIIVLHITVSRNMAGITDLRGMAEYGARPSSKVSWHILVDGEGFDARCVPDAEKAWTQAAYNSVALSIEQIQPADMPREKWLSDYRPQLETVAGWIAKWSVTHGIPIRHSTSSGVCQHRDLGAAGGGHADVGPGYPFDWVLERARKYALALERA